MFLFLLRHEQTQCVCEWPVSQHFRLFILTSYRERPRDIMGDASEVAQQVLSGDLLELVQLVDSSEVIAATSADYVSNTQGWSTSRDKKPRLVLRPKSVASLSGIVAFLSKRDLDYKVRSQGFGSASATDVLISLSAFDDFEFNKDEEYVMLGAGGSWAGYYDRMEAVAPDWTSLLPPSRLDRTLT